MRAADAAIAAIRIYQRVVSPYLGGCCRFHPTCSEYAIGSIALNGAALGIAAAAWRILKCHPFHPGGVDEPRAIVVRFINTVLHRERRCAAPARRATEADRCVR